jgi:hypothetical protein
MRYDKPAIGRRRRSAVDPCSPPEKLDGFVTSQIEGLHEGIDNGMHAVQCRDFQPSGTAIR